MARKTLKENFTSIAMKEVISYLDSDPEKNIPKIINWVEKIDKEGTVSRQMSTIKGYMLNQDNNWYQLANSLFTDIDDHVRKTLFQNFLVNATINGGRRQRKIALDNDCNVPWAILMDPTSACNLKCTGCWAADYGNKLSMSFETLDQIVAQGKELGTYMYIYSGGEPLIRKDDIIKLCDKHHDCAFLAFTNGTLIDESFADEMLRVGNFLPAISVEGFEEATDYRRGIGTYKSVIKAMDLLKSKKLPFGFSSCYTSKNTQDIGSEAFFDEMINRGAKFGWFFTYMPVGVDAVPNLMASSEQREFMYHQIRHFRESKALFTMDFWNDGEFVNGCIAGGRRYLHINANGDIEPCAFIHYSDSSIYEKTLLETYKSPLFMEYHNNQPFNDNHLRPCPLLDNPERLSEMIHNSGATSTEMIHPEDVNNLCSKCRPVSIEWAKTADKLWSKSHNEDYLKKQA